MTPEKPQPSKPLLCNCGEPAVVGVTKYEIKKDGRRLLLCVECWAKWEDEFGHRKFASAVAAG